MENSGAHIQRGDADQLHQLLYFSRYNAAVAFEIGQLLTTSQKNNQDQGITGALLFTGFHFVQLLEGPLQSIEDLYFTKIIADERHSDHQLIYCQQAGARLYGDWAMKFYGTEDAADDLLFSQITLKENSLASLDRHTLAEATSYLQHNYGL